MKPSLKRLILCVMIVAIIAFVSGLIFCLKSYGMNYVLINTAIWGLAALVVFGGFELLFENKSNH